MTNLNPLALVFFVFCACVGYLIGETAYAAVVGLCIGLFMSLIVSMKG